MPPQLILLRFTWPAGACHLPLGLDHMVLPLCLIWSGTNLSIWVGHPIRVHTLMLDLYPPTL